MFHIIKALIIHLLFAKTVCITCGHPVNLTNNWLEIVPKERLEFLNPSAKLMIDVSYQFNKEHSGYTNVSSFYKDKTFPHGGVINLILVCEDGEKIFLNDSHRGMAGSADDVRLIISPARQIEKETNWEDKKIVKILIESSKPIENVELTWANSSK